MAEVFLQQRSKTYWIRIGDDNIKYFYSIIKHKRLYQAITQIKDKAGQIETKNIVIAKVFADFYEELFEKKKRHRV